MLSGRLRGELLRVSGSAPRHAIRALLLMRGDPLCIYTCLLIRLGLWFCIDKWLLIRLELWRCIYTVTYAFRPFRSELLRAQGSDCVATPVCDSDPTSILRGGWDNTAGVSGSGGVGYAIFLDRRRWKTGENWAHTPGVKTPVPCDAGRAKAKALAYPEARTTTTGRTRAGQGDPRLKPWATSHVLPGSDGDGWRVTADTLGGWRGG
jgi:hypothetical protein